MKKTILFLNSARTVDAFLKNKLPVAVFFVWSVFSFAAANHPTFKPAFDPRSGEIGGNEIVIDNNLISNSGNQFFRNSNLQVSDTTEVERHRIWLGLTAANGSLTTILVGYMGGCTAGVDYGFDALGFGGAGQFYSLINGTAYIIQGRPLPFTTTDIVQLGFNATEAGNFTISTLIVDGLFAGDQDILLRDNLTGITNSIKTTPYTFTSEMGIFEDRFEMVYTSVALAVDAYDALKDEVTIYSKDGIVSIQSRSSIESVQIFNLQGQLLSEGKYANNPNINIVMESNLSRQVLIVQLINSTGQKMVKKIIL